ncbi:MAG: epimerase [Deltaproteobacteria bacterium]|nr:MAG: epimerase [Deltaproteobacteria bacterium]
MQNIVITGGCGFIGVNLIRFLMKTDESVCIRVVDNLSVGQLEDLEEIQRSEVGGSRSESEPTGIELVVGDIQDADLAIKACRGMDAVIHLAANTGVIPSIEDPRADCETNVIGTFNYLEACRVNGVKRFVFASSGAPLGEQEPPIHEEMVPKPISPYGASKLCGEAYCSAFHGSFGMETVCLRFGNIYGPYSTHKGSVVAKFIKHIFADEPLPIYGDGNQTRDFIYVEDLVDAILLALEKPNIGGEVFQIATHREHTVGEVADVLNRLAEKHLGRKSEIVSEKERKGEVKRNYSDISKARRILGFEPRFDLKSGLELTFKWFLGES